MNSWIISGLLLFVVNPVQAIQNHLLIVSGIGGQEEYRSQFLEMSKSLYKSARKAGLEKENIVILSGEPIEGETYQYKLSTKKNIYQALVEINARVKSNDRVFVVLIGHGNPRGGSAVFNIPGPDISAEELAEALEMFDSQALIVINLASASGPFIKSLSSKNRIVITATASGREYNATIFGEYFVSAFANPGADSDKNARISMLEAFEYARREVRRSYENDKRLLTEHALLDDNGDGVGSLDPGADDKDGALAKNIYLQQAKIVAAGSGNELVGMFRRKQKIEQSIEQLKVQRDSINKNKYYNQLEELLIDLALLSRRIRAQGG